eukprot:gnl/TRDRNA2_/TRDRNA2_90010_c0_seq2.p1 gnl/TRDRNA2_/TRDRNA2_90010_c0~~gnl/TRDRNA2_/TRDRNA2_90010_c0_seq2.p1  ORF type:complete len:203 (+),score=24.44 gnl/TRDRNA2_/TRDRNA2_90010_c0_seq2:242-850(+)
MVGNSHAAGSFRALTRVAERRVDEFEPQELGNVLWALSMVYESTAVLFRASTRTSGDFDIPSLANTTWAYESTSVLLKLVSVLDFIQSRCTKPQMYQQMMIESLATSGEIVAGFALLVHMETNSCLSDYDEDRYSMLHALLEACRAVGDSHSASRFSAAFNRVGCLARAPTARALVQGLAATAAGKNVRGGCHAALHAGKSS